MEAILKSMGLVAISEIGDKTQLLSLMLVLRYKKPWTIMAGIFAATLANHWASTYVGAWLAAQIPEIWLNYILAAVFFIFGLWILKPDSDEGLETRSGSTVFITTMVAFFLAEMGDKTQLVTIALAARFQSVEAVTIGSTLGMMLANSMSVFGGQKAIKLIPLRYIRCSACALFILFGALILPIW